MRKVSLLLLLAACHSDPPPVTPPPPPPPASTPEPPPTAPATVAPTPPAVPTLTGVPLAPGEGNAGFDFIAYEPGRERIWIPYSRGAGFVDVYDITAKSMTHIAGFGVKAVEDDGKKRVLGPSSAAIGDGVAYIGDRGTNEICTVDLGTLARGECLTLDSAPDCIVYVPSTKELWVTTPKTNSVAVLDASKPKKLAKKATVKTPGAPEGYALDEAHGFFLTNLEDKNRTLRIDLKSRKVASSWEPGCSEEGPRGLQVDSQRGFVLVACTDGVRVLSRDGAVTGKLDAGAGVDDVTYAGGRLYVASGKTALLTIATIGDDGRPTVTATVPTVQRGRNAIADAAGNAYLIDPAGPRLMIVPKP